VFLAGLFRESVLLKEHCKQALKQQREKAIKSKSLLLVHQNTLVKCPQPQYKLVRMH